ncbi:polyprenyl synthetase family protein [Streptomyces monticola]|uniref:Polyprenyl synthetase family protein n=1 Tax=Streptomyces monticola TaxID=2666263 RepID=A0ABW2JLT6_9ACTN
MVRSTAVRQGAVLDVSPAGDRAEDSLDEAVGRALAGLLERQLEALEFLGEHTHSFVEPLRQFVLGRGKRLRPKLVYWGYRGAGGPAAGATARAALRLGCAIELVHAFALIQDDIMDGSRERRFKPAVHVSFENLHRRERWRGDPARFGEAAGLLVADLAFILGDAAVTAAELPPARSAEVWRVFNELRLHLTGGQYLDVIQPCLGRPTEREARRIALYKSARYTVEGPLRLGHAAAGGPLELAATYTAYGNGLGEAFQLRDDVLGVFGDPEVTGKPAGDDIREGKQTMLVLLAGERAGTTGRKLLDAALGRQDVTAEQLDQVRELIVRTGALDEVNRMIDELVLRAKRAVCADGALEEPVRDALVRLADRAAYRAT